MPPLADQVTRQNRNLALACFGWAYGSLVFLLVAQLCFYGAQNANLPTRSLGMVAAMGALAWLPLSGLWLVSAVLDHREFRAQLKATDRLDLAIRRRLIKRTEPLLDGSYVNLAIGGVIWYQGTGLFRIVGFILRDLGINLTFNLPVVCIIGALTWLPASILLTSSLFFARRHLRKLNPSSVTFTQLVRLTHLR